MPDDTHELLDQPVSPELIKPVLDTWGNLSPGGVWVMEFSEIETPSEWAAGVAERSLRALAPVVRPYRFACAADEDYAGIHRIELDWDETTPNGAFAARTVDSLRRFSQLLDAVDWDLDVAAWVRAHRKRSAVLGWSRIGAQLSIGYLPSTRSAYASFTLWTSLFCEAAADKEWSNEELYDKNAPRLEAVLRAWEAAVGDIVTWEGKGLGLYRYGFAPLPRDATGVDQDG